MAHLAGRYTQDVGMAANHGDRSHGYRARNLLARPGRSRERITGSSDKSQRILACRRCPAFAPGGLKRTRAAFAQFRKGCGIRRKSVAITKFLQRHFCQAFHPQRLGAMSIVTRKDVTAMLGELGDDVVTEIIATGTTAEELAEAHAWLANDEPLMNTGRPLPSGRVARVVEIVAAISEEEVEEEVARRS